MVIIARWNEYRSVEALPALSNTNVLFSWGLQQANQSIYIENIKVMYLLNMQSG